MPGRARGREKRREIQIADSHERRTRLALRARRAATAATAAPRPDRAPYGPRPVTGQSRRCASRVTSLPDHRHGGIVIGIVGVAPSRRAARPVPCTPRHLPAISVPISGREIRRWRPWRRRRRHLRRPQELRSRRVRRPRRWLVRHRSHAFLRGGRHAVLNQASCPRRHRDPPIPRHPRYV